MTAAERRTDSLKSGARLYVEGEFGYNFNSLSILAEALDASGDFFRESNCRLALLGDKMAGAAVTAAWYPTGAFRGSFAECCKLTKLTAEQSSPTEP
jgi:hypothetical protein